MADAAFNAWIVIEVELRRENGLLRGIDSENDLAQVLRDVVWPTLSDEFKEKIQEHQETYSKAKGAQGAARETCANFKRFLDEKAGGTANYDFSVEDENDRYDEHGKRKVTLQGYVEQWERLIEARRAFKVAIADLRDLLERYVGDIEPPDERIAGNMTWSQKQLDDMYEEETNLKDADERELTNILLPRLKFGEQRAAERLKTRRQDLGVSNQWIGGWKLGKGGFGSATIWVKQDSQGRIVDRIAVKDTILIKRLWNHNTDFWATDPSEPKDKRNRRNEQPAKAPTETVAMLRLRSRVGAPECIVRIRNWRLQSEKRMYRLLMEYCPYGDLADLVLDSVYSRARQRLHEQGTGNNSLLWIPEPFIWSVFESLATAGLLMAKGELDANPGEPHWWEEIIHRDFKLANIFLGENLESRYRGYPSTKLGDFGLSVILRKDDNRTSEEFTGVGTTGARAPEQAYTYYARPSAATNVWGIGIIIWSLISLDETDESLDWDNDTLLDRIPEQGPEFDAIWARKKVPEIDKNAEQFYSKELVGLMRECLRFDPNMRISLSRLRRRIIKYTQDGRLTNDLRSAEKTNAGFRRDISFAAQEWPLNGLARDVRGFPKGFGGMDKFPVPSSDGGSSDDDDLGGPRGAEIPVRGSQTAGQGTQERHESQAVAGEEGGDGEGRGAPSPPPDPRLRVTGDRRSQAPEPPSPPPDPRLRRGGGRTPEAAEPLLPPPRPRSRVAGDRPPPTAEPLSPPPRPRSRVAGDRPPPAAEPLSPPPRPRSRVAGNRPARGAEPPPPPPDLRPRLARRREGSGSEDDAPAASPTASTVALAAAAVVAAGAAGGQQQPPNEDENEDAAPPSPPRPSRAARQPSNEDDEENAAPPPPPPPRRTRAGNRGGHAAAPPAPARVRGRAAGITRAGMRAAPPPPPPPPPQSEDEEEEEGGAAPRKGKGKGRAVTRGKGKRKRDQDEEEAEEEEEEEEEEVVERPRRRRRRGGRGK
ncbi:hypothetical protein KC351_g11944 [Hortaea werneckii]|nr:hypothetical protein KC351_g11944 [Hortaea werneckii]